MNVVKRYWLSVVIASSGLICAIAIFLFAPASLIRTSFQIEPGWWILILAWGSALLIFVVQLRLERTRMEARRTLEKEVQTLEGDRRRFIQRLDHEMKNPLTSMQLQLDNLAANDSRENKTVQGLREQVSRLTKLTRGLRSLADLETRLLEFENIDIEELLNEVIDILEAPERIRLDVQETPWPIPLIKGDRELLLMTFRNLAQNALNYSSGEVEILARHRSGLLLVEVIDTGRGISEEDMPYVEDELFRGSNVHEVPGSGLGLSIAIRIIERHGGRLELRSRPNQGTIAGVELPCEQA
jgi:two-component system OmpR family sensor kinase